MGREKSNEWREKRKRGGRGAREGLLSSGKAKGKGEGFLGDKPQPLSRDDAGLGDPRCIDKVKLPLLRFFLAAATASFKPCLWL